VDQEASREEQGESPSWSLTTNAQGNLMRREAAMRLEAARQIHELEQQKAETRDAKRSDRMRIARS
jgi:hypothetical protein